MVRIKPKGKRARSDVYDLYFRKVLNQIDPSISISGKAMVALNSFVHDIFERLVTEAVKLAKYNSKVTISSREIQTAVRLLFPGSLAKHAVAEGNKSVTRYTLSVKNAQIAADRAHEENLEASSV